MEAATPPPVPAPAPRSGTSQPIQVGRVISDAFAIYSANLGALLLTGLGIAVVFGIVVGILNDADSFILQLIGSILQLVAAAIYTGFVVKLVQDVRDGKRDQSVGELISAAMPALGALIVYSVLSSIAITIGFFLLIIPGLILMTIWSVGAPAIVAEGRGPVEAFGRSYELVRGQTWTVFGVLVVVFLILLAAFIIVGIIGAAIGGIVGAAVVSVLVMLLYMPVVALVSSTLFFDLGGGANSTL